MANTYNFKALSILLVDDAKPMADLAAACKARGLWPFTHFNRLHVCPPCTASSDEIEEGLSILDEALTIADSHYVG